MAGKTFVSFDWDHDRDYKYLLEAWSANPRFKFVWADGTPDEIQSKDVGRVKAALTVKICDASQTLVIVGRYANARHRDAPQIGYKNWINFEVAQSKAAGKRLVAVKLDPSFEPPDELANSGATWVYGFNEAGIRKALEA